jgi:hypothetical protein
VETGIVVLLKFYPDKSKIPVMRIPFLPYTFLMLILSTMQAKAQPDDISSRLFDVHQKYRETTFTQRRFKQKDMLPLIEKRKSNPLYEVTSVGTSFEERNIQMLKIGNGTRKILLWSQMHGDEPTATMACFDIFNFFEGEKDGFDAFRKEILSNTTLYFIPMLNPDGAERYQRRNAQGIDINRDALGLQAPESRILKGLQQNLQPEFGFNLHDKNPRYSVGNTDKLATISFLATAYDEAKSVNTVREKSMQVISVMNRALQKYIPGQVGRWNDDFEPRAFGDNIQKWGTTLILIESGGYSNDPEKQYIRKLNFVAMLTGIGSIADNSFAKETRDDYEALKENSRFIFDLLISNVTAGINGKTFRTDVAIDRTEVNQHAATSFFYRSTIEEYGDLSIYSGTQQLDGTGCIIEHGKVYPDVFPRITDIQESKAWDLLRQGFTYLRVAKNTQGAKSVKLPVNLITNERSFTAPPALDDPATFILRKNGKPRYAVVNGFVYDLEAEYKLSGNSLID